MRDEQIINSREMILKVFSNIDKKRFEEKDSVENAWKKITTSIKNGSKEDIGAKLFSHSSLVDVKDGILLIETDHPGFIQLFRMHEMYILRGLKKFVPQLEIRCLSFRLRGSKAVLSEIENEINLFKENKTNILIAITIIDVGVNIPNANVIVIKNAERFGLSQLHQFRGGVGRGNSQGY